VKLLFIPINPSGIIQLMQIKSNVLKARAINKNHEAFSIFILLRIVGSNYRCTQGKHNPGMHQEFIAKIPVTDWML